MILTGSSLLPLNFCRFPVYVRQSSSRYCASPSILNRHPVTRSGFFSPSHCFVATRRLLRRFSRDEYQESLSGFSGAPSGRSRRLPQTTRPPGTAYSRRHDSAGREEALSSHGGSVQTGEMGSRGIPRRGIDKRFPIHIIELVIHDSLFCPREFPVQGSCAIRSGTGRTIQ